MMLVSTGFAALESHFVVSGAKVHRAALVGGAAIWPREMRPSRVGFGAGPLVRAEWNLMHALGTGKQIQ